MDALKGMFGNRTARSPEVPALKPIPALAVANGMKNVCADGLITRGIDVSSYQPQVDWATIRREGYLFAFIKCSEGAFHMDRMFRQHWEAARAAGVIRGAYHYFHPGTDPIAQARLISKCVGVLGENDLPVALDWETTDKTPSAVDLAAGLACLEEIERLTKKRPIIYTGPYFMTALNPSVKLARYPLWIAHYGAKCPLVPFPWANWMFWQTSGSMRVAGIPGDVDSDVFNGTLPELKQFILASEVK